MGSSFGKNFSDDWKVVGVKGRAGAPFQILGYVGRGYCEIGRGRVLARGEAGWRIEVEEMEVGIYEGFCDEGTSRLRKCIWRLRVPDRAMSVEVSHDDVVFTEAKKKVKVWCEIGRTTGYRGDVNSMNVGGGHC